MNFNLLTITAAVSLALSPIAAYAQPTLGSTAEFVLFTSSGALTNTGLSHLTGHVGSNSGSSTGFGNVNGVMYNNNGKTGTAAADLTTLYGQLNSAVATLFPAPALGNGQSLNAGIYSISGNSTLTNTLTLNGQNNASAVFIIKIQGTFSAASGSKVILTNGALACNVFWKVEGAVGFASGASLKGTFVANNAAINMSSGAILEGRALSTTGAITINAVKAYLPTGCGSPTLTGPAAPALLSTVCYVLFSKSGPVTNTGTTFLTGDVGTNVGLTTGYQATNVTGTIHPIPDGSTSSAATDLGTLYTSLNTLAYDIELLYPAQFGKSLVLTPHVYRLSGATTLTDTLFLNAAGNANAVFVIQINGALSTSTYAKIALINGTQARNVFWKIEGAINIANNSQMEGTMIANNGAVNLTTGVKLNGRAFTTTGSLQSDAITAIMPSGCATNPVGLNTKFTNSQSVTVYPNPFAATLEITVNEQTDSNPSEISIYNLLGEMLFTMTLTKKTTTLQMDKYPAGVYFYKHTQNSETLQSGRLVSQN